MSRKFNAVVLHSTILPLLPKLLLSEEIKRREISAGPMSVPHVTLNSSRRPNRGVSWSDPPQPFDHESLLGNYFCKDLDLSRHDKHLSTVYVDNFYKGITLFLDFTHRSVVKRE